MIGFFFEKEESFKVYIKTQPGNINSDTVFIYLPVIKTGYVEAPLHFLVLLEKIL